MRLFSNRSQITSKCGKNKKVAHEAQCFVSYLMIMIMGICSGAYKEWLFVHWNLDLIIIWKCWFLRRGENRSSRRKTSRSREENQQQAQPTYCVESENRSRATSVGGECSHHCAIPASLTLGELAAHVIIVAIDKKANPKENVNSFFKLLWGG